MIFRINGKSGKRRGDDIARLAAFNEHMPGTAFNALRIPELPTLEIARVRLHGNGLGTIQSPNQDIERNRNQHDACNPGWPDSGKRAPKGKGSRVPGPRQWFIAAAEMLSSHDMDG